VQELLASLALCIPLAARPVLGFILLLVKTGTLGLQCRFIILLSWLLHHDAREGFSASQVIIQGWYGAGNGRYLLVRKVLVV
jgi:hypothetical protein